MLRNLIFKLVVIFSLLLFLTEISAQNASPVVEISTGQVRGTTRSNWDGESFYAFLSVPYAKPPIDDLRFKAPQPAEPWNGVRDATKQGKACLQGDIGDEDCLHLHIFTKSLPSEEDNLKPVMVFIHGGIFIEGSNDINRYGPDFLMTEDILLVTIQYRLNVLGFLSIEGSDEIPGNAGLKDQVLALKWVQENIRNFNGDPNAVTIFGQSAGAASVEYLILSPSAKNLFHRAIMDSGSSLCNWARLPNITLPFSKYLRLPKMRKLDNLTRLMETPSSVLAAQYYNYSLASKTEAIEILGPVIEKPNPTAFITQNSIDIIQSGVYNRVPIMSGYNTMEALFMEFFRRLIGFNIELPMIFYLPADTDYTDHAQVNGMIEIIKGFYNLSNPNEMNLAVTDAWFVGAIIPSVINHAKFSQNPVYFYRFSLDAGLNYYKVTHKIDVPGAAHSDELGYLFNSAQIPLPTAELEKTSARRMVKLWTNFAKYGNPTPDKDFLNVDWKPIDRDNIHFLDIGEDLVPSVNPEAERMQVWKELYKLNNITSRYFGV